jgi:branched-chain amino acid transport system substrate-binding protein
VKIRDILTDMKTFQGYEGVTGKMMIDQSWNNVRNIFMAEVHNGKFAFTPAPPLDMKHLPGAKTGNY